MYDGQSKTIVASHQRPIRATNVSVGSRTRNATEPYRPRERMLRPRLRPLCRHAHAASTVVGLGLGRRVRRPRRSGPVPRHEHRRRSRPRARRSAPSVPSRRARRAGFPVASTHGRGEPGDPLVDLLTLAGPAVAPHLGDLGEERIEVDDRLRRDLLEPASPRASRAPSRRRTARGRACRRRSRASGQRCPSRHRVLERPDAVDEVDRDAGACPRTR